MAENQNSRNISARDAQDRRSRGSELASGTANHRQRTPVESYFPLETLRVTAAQPLGRHRHGGEIQRAGQTSPAAGRTARLARCGTASPALAAIRCEPAGRVESRRLVDARFAHERAQEIRPAGRAQTVPILETLIALEISSPLVQSGGVFCFGRDGVSPFLGKNLGRRTRRPSRRFEL